MAEDKTEACIICLESKPLYFCFKKDTIKHIPCTCNAYTHEYCFFKLKDKEKCFICKNKYPYTFGNYPNKQDSNKCSCNNLKKNFKNHCKLSNDRIKYWLQNLCLSIDKYFFFNNNISNKIINCIFTFFYITFGLIFILFSILICLIIGGYFLNFTICLFFNSYFEANGTSCIFSITDSKLYILGFFGFPLLTYCCSCFVSFFKKSVIRRSSIVNQLEMMSQQQV